jgi:hypothetical protein
MIHFALTIAAALFLAWVGFIAIGVFISIFSAIFGPKKYRYKGTR